MAASRDHLQLLEDESMHFEVSNSGMAADLEVTPSFEAMGLKEDLLRGIFAYGFERPSAIQQRAIRPIVSGRDAIAQSPSGTGKTGVFSFGVLQVKMNRSEEQTYELQY